jgi:hypothetical protein
MPAPRGRGAVALVLLAGAMTLSAGGARADDQRGDLTRITAGDVAISSKACRSIPVRVSWRTAPGWDVSSASADVYRGSTPVASEDLSRDTDHLWCPDAAPWGTYTFGPGTQVLATHADGPSASWSDNTRGHFHVRYDSASFLTVTRSGRNVSFSARASRYDLKASNWVPFNSSRFQLQYKSGTTWVPLKNLSPTAGRASWAYGYPTARTYRMITTATYWTWARPSAATNR